MSDYTSKLNLYKVDPAIDGEDTFNINTMMNDNWDKIDEKVGNMDEKLSNVEDNANNYHHPDTHDADMIRIKDEGGKFTGDDVEDALGEVGSQLADVAYYKSDSETYQTPTIIGTQIRLKRQSNTKRLFFKLSSDLSGGDITISLDNGTTEINLKDIENVNVTELGKGFVEVVEDTSFFTYAPKGRGIKIEGLVERLANVKSGESIKSGDLVKVFGDTVSLAPTTIDNVGEYNLVDSSKLGNIIKIDDSHFLLSEYQTVSIVKIDENGFLVKGNTVATNQPMCSCGVAISETRAVFSYNRGGGLITFNLATNTISSHHYFSFKYSYQTMWTGNFVVVDDSHVIMIGHNDYFDDKHNQYAMLTIDGSTSVTVGQYVAVNNWGLGNGSSTSTYIKIDETHFLSVVSYNGDTFSWMFTVVSGVITNMVSVNLGNTGSGVPLLKMLDSHTLLTVMNDTRPTVGVYEFNNDFSVATLKGNSVSLNKSYYSPTKIFELNNGNLRVMSKRSSTGNPDTNIVIDYEYITTDPQLVVTIVQELESSLNGIRLYRNSRGVKIYTDEIYCYCTEPSSYNVYKLKRLKTSRDANGVATQNGNSGATIKIQQW